MNTSTIPIWGKTDQETSNPGKWLPLSTHLTDTAETASLIWNEWIPSNVKARLDDCLGSSNAMPTLMFLASIHDVGKISPLFETQAADAYSGIIREQSENGLVIPELVSTLPRGSRPSEYRHEKIGASALYGWLLRHDVSEKVAATYAQIIAGHHGGCLDYGALKDLGKPSMFKGDSKWGDLREAYLDEAYERYPCVFSETPLTKQTQLVLTGFLVVSDWISSNQDLFPLDPSRETDGYPTRAVASCNLPSPWTPQLEEQDAGKLFSKRFDRPSTMIRPFQKEVVDAAFNMDSPGIMCVEAPMGEGKTEAAFLAAEVLASRFGLGGLYFALPTQATADSVYGRMMTWRSHLPDTPGSTYLSHRHSTGIMKQLGRETEWSWLDGRYRRTMHNMVVGTVDQILLSARKAKYLVLRHLSFVGKVLVIDEVHAYDEYMTVYLERALEWLGSYHVPVILMSATLPNARRVSLLQAYATGAGYSTEQDTNNLLSPWKITVLDSKKTNTRYPKGSSRHTTITTEMTTDEEGIQTAIDIVKAGGCALIIKDTVNRANRTYEKIKATGTPTLLVHSRFTVADRQKLDHTLIEDFGPQQDHRPPMIVVATQVAEQSLDVDFDIIVSDIAPIDLLLQRAGRLFRHDRTSRPVSNAKMLITGANGYPEGIGLVYDPWILDQTTSSLQSHPQWNLPEDIPELVESVYSKAIEGPEGKAFKRKIKAKQAEARRALIPHAYGRSTCLDGWLNNAPTTGSVRDGGPVTEAYLGEKSQENLIQLTESSLGYLDANTFIESMKDHEWAAKNGNITIPTDNLPFTINTTGFTYTYNYSKEYGWQVNKQLNQ
ncbi:CRISPR-associated helicase Cas3' [Bifidobacterium callitrichidarum]|nr:CRISPR-associated helicase Cas3' [Bifidobacterium callitrichidarum]